jgi:ABC-type bacteriocin/lantibiotic exporter with double-glycine peptidase domain
MKNNYKSYLIEMIKPSKLLFGILIFFITIQNLNNFFSPYLSKFIFDKFFIQKDYNNFVSLLLLYIVLYTFMNIQLSIHSFVRTKYLQSSILAFRKKVMRILFNKDFIDFNKFSFGDIATIIRTNINSANSLMLAVIETIFIQPLFLSISFVYLFNISPIFILFIVLESVGSFIIVHFITNPIEKAYKNQLEGTALYNRHLEKNYNSYEDVRMNYISDIALVRLFRVFIDYKSRTMKVAKYDILYELSEALKGVFFDISAILFSIYLIKNNLMTVGDYIAFIAIKPKCVSALGGFAKLKLYLRKIKVYIDGIEKVIPLEKYKKRINESNDNLLDEINSISFNNVDFSYSDKELLFSDFSYQFIKNRIYIIEGGNGTGKTTLLRMLAKLCNPQNGEILLNDTPLADISEKELSSKISVLTQHPRLYDDTLENNINILGISNEEIQYTMQKIVKYFNINEIIAKYENGEKSNIYEIALSGGQQKKVCLARTLLYNSNVLIFDEPFAALDKESQKNLEKMINEISEDKIIIIISHKKDIPFNNNTINLKMMKSEQSNIILKEA